MSRTSASSHGPQAAGVLSPAMDDVRCDCGSLLARWTAAGMEIKCRRCKRLVVLPLESIGGNRPRSPPNRD
jgi:hypothetical protein